MLGNPTFKFVLHFHTFFNLCKLTNFNRITYLHSFSDEVIHSFGPFMNTFNHHTFEKNAVIQCKYVQNRKIFKKRSHFSTFIISDLKVQFTNTF